MTPICPRNDPETTPMADMTPIWPRNDPEVTPTVLCDTTEVKISVSEIIDSYRLIWALEPLSPIVIAN